MRNRGAAILSTLIVAAVALASCAEFGHWIDRPSDPVPVREAPPPAHDTVASLPEVPQPPKPEPQIVKGTGQFIDAEAARLPRIQVTKEGDVILNFAGADIQDVVRSIMGTMLKLNYVVHPKVQGQVTVQTSRPVSRDSLLPTLESILRIHGAAIVRDGGVYKVVPVNEAPSAGAKPSIDLPRGVRGEGFGIQIVPLEFVSAREMEKILQPVSPPGAILRVDVARNLLLLTGTLEERRHMLDMVKIFDVDWLAGMSVALIPLQAAEPKALIEDLQQVFGNAEDGPLAGVVRFQPIERLNSILVVTSRPEYLDKAKSWIERLDGGVEGGERSLHVYLVQNGRAADLADVLNQIFGDKTSESTTRRSKEESGPRRRTERRRQDSLRRTTMPGTRTSGTTTTNPTQGGAAQLALQARQVGRPPVAPSAPAATPDRKSEIAADTVRIIADEKNNALIILATPREYRSVLAALEKLDIRPLQVLIEATIAEVKLNDELRYGLQWFFKKGASQFTLSNSTTTGPNLGGTLPGFSYLLGLSDARVVLDALDNVTDFKVISSPQVLVLDNETATLTVGDEVPVATQQSTTTDEANPRTINQIQFRETGIILTVTPRVNSSGLINLDIAQEASNVVETVSSGIDSPTIRQRKIESSIAVASGQTIALGGLIDERNTKTSSGFPVLSRIPILGALFGSKSDTGERTEILILITPRIIRNQEDARVVTEELRNRVRALIPLDKRIK